MKRLCWIGISCLLVSIALSGCDQLDQLLPPLQPTEPAGFVASLTSSAPVLDGDGSDGAWNRATPYLVTVGESLAYANNFGTFDVMLKALYDSENIYILATWNDPSQTESVHHKRWSFDGTGWNRGGSEDRIFFMFDPGDNGTEGADCATMCHQPTPGKMGTTGGGHVDVWHWKAGRTAAAGFADDKWWDETGRHSDSKISSPTRANINAAGDGPEWMHPDGPAYAGDFLFEDTIVPFDSTLDWTGKSIPGHILGGPADGSRWDIRAGSTYQNGVWTVELQRALDTGNPDDVVLGTGDVQLSIAVTDNSGPSHSGAPPFILKFE